MQFQKSAKDPMKKVTLMIFYKITVKKFFLENGKYENNLKNRQ